MATSGSRDFKLDVSDVIEEAYELIGMELRTGYDAHRARRSLNIMFQDWANRGINLWTINQVSLTLTADTASYTLNEYDIDVLEAVVRRSGLDYAVNRISREDYLHIPNKATTGRPSQLYFERASTPKINLWPTPDNSTDTLISYRVQRVQDADTLTDDVDVPSRFIPAMVSGLAFYLAVKLAPERAIPMKELYESDFRRAADEDSDWGSLNIAPSRAYGR
jgi:hypothetical protein